MCSRQRSKLIRSPSRDNQYNLYIRVDTNTQGHRQWYFFSACNKKCAQPKTIYRFNIYKFHKKKSLYSRGMRPYTFSKKEFQALAAKQNNENIQDLYSQCWKQGGSKAKYISDGDDEDNEYFILTFDYEFKHENDEIYFAACPPFSYTTMSKKFVQYNKRQEIKHTPRIETLTKSVCGLDVPLVTVRHKYSQQSHHKYIVIIGRSHPGESSGSWVMDGLIDWLYSNQPEVQQLLTKATIKIIPMMNSDGVFMGNYRTGITGKDFNRSFHSGKATLFPEISAVKLLIEQLQQKGEVLAFLDLHGHSVLRGSFIFGPNQSGFTQNRFKRFPEELAEKSALFRYGSCKFRNEKSKIQIARVFFQIKHGLLSYTIENSLGLWRSDDGRTYPIRIEDWRYFGRQLGEVLSDLAVQANLSKPFSLDQKYFSNEMLILKRKRHRDEMSMQLQAELRNVSLGKGGQFNSPEHTESVQEESNQIAKVSSKVTHKISRKSRFLQSKFKIYPAENDTQIQPLSAEDDALSQNYSSDSNDEDSESEDLPTDILNSIYRAIELKQYSMDSYRTVSNKGIDEKCTEQVIHEEILRNKKFMHRNTNAFKEMKLSIRRLTPRNIHKKIEEHNTLVFNDSYYGDKATPRDIETSMGRLTKGIQLQKVSKPSPAKLKTPATTTKLIDFEKEIMEQVSHEIDNRLKRITEKPRSIFSTKISGNEKPGHISIHPKFLYAQNYK